MQARSNRWALCKLNGILRRVRGNNSRHTHSRTVGQSRAEGNSGQTAMRF